MAKSNRKMLINAFERQRLSVAGMTHFTRQTVSAVTDSRIVDHGRVKWLHGMILMRITLIWIAPWLK